MIVEIPQSTALRWVRVNSDGTALTGSLPNYTNRLNYHWLNVPNSVLFDYPFKFITEDIIQNQFTTDADTITIGLYNYLDDTLVSDLSGDEVSVYTYGSGANIYDFDIDSALLGGCYYVRYTFEKTGDPTEYWQSERFDVDAFSTDETILLEWANSERMGVYNPSGKFYKVRVDARFFKINFADDKASYVDSDYKISVQDGAPILNVILELGDVPMFVAEKLNLALMHDNLKVNGEAYQTEESLEIEVWSVDAYTTNTALGNIVLRKVVYENEFLEISDDTPPETNCILINTSNDRLLWNDTDCLLWA